MEKWKILRVYPVRQFLVTLSKPLTNRVMMPYSMLKGNKKRIIFHDGILSIKNLQIIFYTDDELSMTDALHVALLQT